MDLFDTDNAFNRINRYLMLWQCCHRWNQASRFVFNRYRHWNLMLVRGDPGDKVEIIHSKEGTAQGCSSVSKCFAIGLLPLVEKMREQHPDALQPWFADDISTTGTEAQSSACLAFLRDEGPWYGLFISDEKSWYVCKANDEPLARSAFAQQDLHVQYTRGHCYLGGFVGSRAARDKWLIVKVDEWAAAVRTLARVAERYPQAAYVGFTFCLQNEWQYVQRIVQSSGTAFAPLEVAIREALLPSLLGISGLEIDAEFRQLLSQSLKCGGLAIRNPMDTAMPAHEISTLASSHLVDSLLCPQEPFHLQRHMETVTAAASQGRKDRIEREMDFLGERATKSPAVGRRDKRASQMGIWLSLIPSRENGTTLSANEWRDNVRLRYNIAPLHMPSHCDGCGAKLMVEHALQCRIGGLVIARHNDVADEFRDLCRKAFSFGRVAREPPDPRQGY